MHMKYTSLVLVMASLLLLSACAPAGGPAWGSISAGSYGTDKVGVLGPSGPIGP